MYITDNIDLTEKLASWKDHQPNWLGRNLEYNPEDNVIARVLRMEGGKSLEDYIFGANIVCTTGAFHYLQLMASDTPTNDFPAGTMVINNPSSADTLAVGDDFADVNSGIAGSFASGQNITATYPNLNNSDAGNPGGGAAVLTWKQSWTAAQFNSGATDIKGGAIVKDNTPTGTDPILNHWNFTSPFGKLSTEPLDVWINHTLVGV